MRVLGIETSCDETAVALLEIDDKELKVVASLVSSQNSLHNKYGGVVPEMAARQHSQNLIPLLSACLNQSGIELKEVDLFAVTCGPGLAGALMVGLETAKTLSFLTGTPLVLVNHLQGHLWSNFLPLPNVKVSWSVAFPFLSLIVSGGHTELVLVKSFIDYLILGKTLDDAAGEAFDKVAKLLGLEYPGGPAISRLAASGDNQRFSLPRPLLNSQDLSFSFSGLKTAVLYSWRQQTDRSSQAISDMAASFEAAVIDVLLKKTVQARKKYNPKFVSISGGVSANQALRRNFQKNLSPDVTFKVPEFIYTGDNAAMIALAGFIKWRYDKSAQDYFKAQQFIKAAVQPNLNI